MSKKSFLLLTTAITFFTAPAFAMSINEEDIKNASDNPSLCHKALLPVIDFWAQKNEKPAREILGFTDDDRSKDDPSYPGYAIAVNYIGHPDFLVNARFNEKSPLYQIFSFWDPRHPKYFEAAKDNPAHPYNQMVALQKDPVLAVKIAETNPNHPYIQLLTLQDPNHVLFQTAAQNDPNHPGHIAYLYKTRQNDPSKFTSEELENKNHPAYLSYVLNSPHHPKYQEIEKGTTKEEINAVWKKPNININMDNDNLLYPLVLRLANEHPQYLDATIKDTCHPEYWNRIWTDPLHPKYVEVASRHPHHRSYKTQINRFAERTSKGHRSALTDSNHPEFRTLAWTNPDHDLYNEYAAKYPHHPGHVSQTSKAAQQ